MVIVFQKLVISIFIHWRFFMVTILLLSFFFLAIPLPTIDHINRNSIIRMGDA